MTPQNDGLHIYGDQIKTICIPVFFPELPKNRLDDHSLSSLQGSVARPPCKKKNNKKLIKAKCLV
jgi:hypothetical protein